VIRSTIRPLDALRDLVRRIEEGEEPEPTKMVIVSYVKSKDDEFTGRDVVGCTYLEALGLLAAAQDDISNSTRRSTVHAKDVKKARRKRRSADGD
jgi:hypothetical protein